MAKNKKVCMDIEHQIIVLGQIGNLYATVKYLRDALMLADLNEFESFLRAIEIEVEMLEKYFPPLTSDFPRFVRITSGEDE